MLLRGILVDLRSRFGIHLLRNKAVFDNLIDILTLMTIYLLDLIALLNKPYWVADTHLRLLQVIVLCISPLLIR